MKKTIHDKERPVDRRTPWTKGKLGEIALLQTPNVVAIHVHFNQQDELFIP